ncbi:MAG: ribosome-binding factor A [Nitrosomonas sp.]|nr:ribosome-binding factor A [Nitrosomonas sp.]
MEIALTAELGDQKLQDLEIINVSLNDDGQFLHVLIGNHNASKNDEVLILSKLQALQGYLRSEIARSVKRKHVPVLKFQWANLQYKENNHADSENHQ